MGEETRNKLTPSGLPGRQGIKAVEKPKNAIEVIVRLWKYLRKEKKLLLLVALLLLINTGTTVLGSYLLRPIINDYIIPGNIPGLMTMIGILLFIYLTGAFAFMGQNRLMITAAQRTVSDIRTDLFSKLQSLPIRFYDSNSHGELLSRFTNDMDNISDALNSSITQFVSSLITLTGIFVLMLVISPILTLVTLVIVPFMLWIAGRIIKQSKKYFMDQQIALGTTDGYIEEIISGQKVVRIFGHESFTAQEFAKHNEDLRDKATKAQLYSGIMMPVIQNLNTINFALTATLGGVLTILTHLDIGGLAAFLQYSRQFGRPVNEMSNQYNSLQVALASAERVFQIIDELPESADAPNAVALVHKEGEVEFKNVVFSYETGKIILNNISLQAKKGQKIALVGETGAGKTTIMNLLPRFYDIQSGSITIDGIDIQHIQRTSLRQSMAIVLQETHLFTGTVLENIRYGRLEATDEEVIEAAKRSGADSFIKRLPLGYQTLLEGTGTNLSEGQRQLLNIARAAVANPYILILDEATSSIDTRTEIIIQAGLDRLMQGRTSFVIAHRLSTVQNADKIVVLENGAISESGTHTELLQQKGKYHQLYQNQFD